MSNAHARKVSPREVLAEGRFVRLVAQDGWEWVERVNTSGAAVIVAVTRERELLLVEQYRIPMGARVIELPAGLAGDLAGSELEHVFDAAHRELFEETGYKAESFETLTEGPSSAGLSNETYTLLLARNVERAGHGGGDEGEDIEVHRIPIDEAAAWLEARRKAGVHVDPRVYAGLYFAARK